MRWTTSALWDKNKAEKKYIYKRRRRTTGDEESSLKFSNIKGILFSKKLKLDQKSNQALPFFFSFFFLDRKWREEKQNWRNILSTTFRYSVDNPDKRRKCGDDDPPSPHFAHGSHERFFVSMSTRDSRRYYAVWSIKRKSRVLL